MQSSYTLTSFIYTFYLDQVWTGPLSPYRAEISTCIRIQSRSRFLLCLQSSDCSTEGVREFMPDFGSAVNGVFVPVVPLAVEAWDTSFGTILCGLETMRSAWPTSSLSVLVAVPKALLLCPSRVSCSLDHAARYDSPSRVS